MARAGGALTLAAGVLGFAASVLRWRRMSSVFVGAAALAACSAPPAPAAAQATRLPVDGDGMWIWYVSRSGGSAERIAQTAKANRIESVLIKSSEAGDYWEQFDPALVAGLRARGLRVCAWPFVYGLRPKAEAKASVRAVRAGADCLVIDAETSYEGRYGAADAYIRKLRREVGRSYPIGLTSFPYVDYHPAFPYSVFLGRGGARFNVPQVYWKAIGHSVRRATAHTYRWNAPYDRPIYPLGQTWQDPPRKQLLAFRRLAASYGSKGLSWWSWQETSRREWRALSRRIAPPADRRPKTYPRLRRGDRGDVVVQAQALLRAAGERPGIDGRFRSRTRRAVREFQRAHALKPTGVISPTTWRRLLEREPVRVRWSRRTRRPRAAAGDRRSAPASATLPAIADEIGSRRGAP